MRLVSLLLQAERLPQLPRCARGVGGGRGGADLALAAPLQPQRVGPRPGGGLRRAGEGGQGRAAPRARGLAQEADLRVALIKVETFSEKNRQLIFQSVKHWFNVGIDVH